MATQKTIVLVTGASGGIGLETARQLGADASKHVLLCSRSETKGEEVIKQLASENLAGSIELLVLDVDDSGAIERAAKIVQEGHGRLDVLINNAVCHYQSDDVSIEEKMARSFKTNSIAPELMVRDFAPLLSNSTQTPRIINISSGAGSIARRLNGQTLNISAIEYRASKAALNMVTANQAVEYGPKGWKVFAFNPGFTVNSRNTLEDGAQATSEAVKPLIEIVDGERDEEHGCFLNGRKGQYSW